MMNDVFHRPQGGPHVRVECLRGEEANERRQKATRYTRTCNLKEKGGNTHIKRKPWNTEWSDISVISEILYISMTLKVSCLSYEKS